MNEEEKAIRMQFQNILNKLVNNKIAPTGTAILAAEQPMILLFEELMYKIRKQQKELEPIKKLNIPVETLVSEFNRLEDLEDNTEMLKSELEKKNAVIDKMAEMLVEDKEWFYSEFDNYSKEQFKDYFKNLVEKENK